MTDIKPTREFRSMHIGRRGKPKIAHKTWAGAWLHKRRIANKYKLGTDRAQIYPCWFRDDNTIGKKRHWHVGHSRFSGWVEADPSSRVIGKAAAEGGYRLSVVLTALELEQLDALAGDTPVQEFVIRAILGLARTERTCCHLDPAGCIYEASKNGRRITNGEEARERVLP